MSSKSNPFNQIYAIAGKRGSGKTTFASIVQKYNKNFKIISFASELKNMAIKIFKLLPEDTEILEKKECLLKNPIYMDEYLTEMRDLTGLDITKKGLIAKTPREVLQFFGTNYVRSVQDSYWIERCILEITQCKKQILIPDLRFLNEADAVRHVGGKIIKIERMEFNISESLHPSEIEMDKIEPDAIFKFISGKLSLMERIAYLISIHKPNEALKFDYRNIEKSIECYKNGSTLYESSKYISCRGKKHSDLISNIFKYYVVPLRSKAKERKSIHRENNGIEEKWCNTGKHWISIIEFNKSSRSWDFLNSRCRECQSKYNKKLNNIVSIKSIYENIRKMAPYRKIKFNITLSDLEYCYDVQKGKCFYSGRNLIFEKHDIDKISVDRIDSSEGYTPDNIVFCTKSINSMKNNLSTKQFYSIINDIYNKKFNKNDWLK